MLHSNETGPNGRINMGLKNTRANLNKWQNKSKKNNSEVPQFHSGQNLNGNTKFLTYTGSS
jgi:hypothetical protein